MKDPIHELHFVPFETALRLRDAGYDEESLFVYRYNTQTKDGAELICLGSPKKNIELKKYSTVSALTVEEAAEWLREKFHFIISLYPVINKDLIDDLSFYTKEENLLKKEMYNYNGVSWVERIYHLREHANGITLQVLSEDDTPKTSFDYYQSYINCINYILNSL